MWPPKCHFHPSLHSGRECKLGWGLFRPKPTAAGRTVHTSVRLGTSARAEPQSSSRPSGWALSTGSPPTISARVAGQKLLDLATSRCKRGRLRLCEGHLILHSEGRYFIAPLDHRDGLCTGSPPSISARVAGHRLLNLATPRYERGQPCHVSARGS